MNIQTPSKKKWVASPFILVALVVVLATLAHIILVSLYGKSYIKESFRLALTLNTTVLIISITLTYQFLSIKLLDISGIRRVVGLASLGFCAYLVCDLSLSFMTSQAFFWQFWEYQLLDFWWVGVIFLGALSEELVFRRYLIDLGKALGVNLLVSILISSALFALFHLGGLESPTGLIISGVVYCIVTVMTRSIAFAVGAHFGFNLLAGLEGVESLDHSFSSNSEIANSILLDVGLFAIFLLGYYLNTMLSKPNSKPIDYSA